MKKILYFDKPVLAKGRNVVGIDIGKYKHSAAAVTVQGELLTTLATFTNDRDGVDRLEAQVLKAAGEPKDIIFALEATGHYWMALYHELDRRGYHGVVLNPIQTNGEARTRIRKTKTDKRDAEGIARFILTGKAHAARIPDEQTLELRVLTRRRLQLMQMKGNIERGAQSLTDRVFPEYDQCFSKPFLPSCRAMICTIGFSPASILNDEEQTRELLKSASRGKLKPEVVDNLLLQAKQTIGIKQGEQIINQELRATMGLLEYLEQQISAIEVELKHRMEMRDSPLLSLGIGPVLAATIHAESDPISDFPTARQYAAFAGLEPSTYESGEMHGTQTHISKRGSPYLRNALYQSAFIVYQKHAHFERIYSRFRKKGQKHTSALVTVTRRLSLVVWRMLTDNRKFTKRAPKKE